MEIIQERMIWLEATICKSFVLASLEVTDVYYDLWYHHYKSSWQSLGSYKLGSTARPGRVPNPSPARHRLKVHRPRVSCQERREG